MTPVPLEERTLTESDHLQLTRLIERAGRAPLSAPLRDLLDAADIVPEAELPPDVVSMYSRVLLVAPGTDSPYTLTLCYPADANAATGHVSVTSPVGCSLLGQRAGCLAHWRTPDGAAGTAEIAEVLFQPESQRARRDTLPTP